MDRTLMWRRYLRFWGSDVRADVDAELDHHMRELTERLVHEGRSPAEARAEAERRFGDYARVKEACVDIDQGWERQRRWRQLLADLWQDLRIGARTLAKNPVFTISAVVVLGLGLGAATVMVSVTQRRVCSAAAFSRTGSDRQRGPVPAVRDQRQPYTTVRRFLA